jgi:AcrR family transcriptional regulator
MGADLGGTRVRRVPADRRRDLLDAGLKVLAAKGGPATTVADIAAEAGVAKGTFYLYFDSKDDLLVALRDRITADFLARIAHEVGGGGALDWWGIVDRYVEGVIDFLLDHAEVHQAVWHSGPDPRTTRSALDTYDLISGLIEQGVAEGLFAVSDPPLAAILLFSALHGLADDAFIVSRADRDRIVAAGKELVHKALAPARP